ncbi:hypothetical protein GCM10007880_61550 [Mesorhizobium amorphae]|nr:hypothetical protein GCM10007880_61550 [Mesorhizobium amorphae]
MRGRWKGFVIKAEAVKHGMVACLFAFFWSARLSKMYSSNQSCAWLTFHAELLL